MKKEYLQLKIELVELDLKDVVTVSGMGDNDVVYPETWSARGGSVGQFE